MAEAIRTIAYRSVASNSGTGLAVTCDKPANTADGDVLLCEVFAYATPAPTITAPAGWSKICEDVLATSITAIYSKVASSEGASYEWSRSDGDGVAFGVYITAYSGCDADPIDTYSNTAYTTDDTTLRAATVTPSETGCMLVFMGWVNASRTATVPANFTERLDTTLQSKFVYLADRLYASTDATGNVDATLSSSFAAKHAYIVVLAPEHYHYPTITEPDAADAFRDSVAVQFECSCEDPGDSTDPVFYTWEIDTATPPVSTNADYVTLSSGYVAEETAASVYNTFARTDRGTWYCRAKASNGTDVSDWSDIVTFSIIEGVRILPGASISTSTLEVANKVYVVVDKSSPLVQEDATNTTDAPTYANSPRETLVIIKAGDATAAQAVADATLALRKVKRTNLSGIPVPLRYGLGIQRGQKVNVTIPRASVSGTYAVRRVAHDFGSNVSIIDVGEFNRPRDQEDALVSLAKTLAKIEKESALA